MLILPTTNFGFVFLCSTYLRVLITSSYFTCKTIRTTIVFDLLATQHFVLELSNIFWCQFFQRSTSALCFELYLFTLLNNQVCILEKVTLSFSLKTFSYCCFHPTGVFKSLSTKILFQFSNWLIMIGIKIRAVRGKNHVL